MPRRTGCRARTLLEASTLALLTSHAALAGVYESPSFNVNLHLTPADFSMGCGGHEFLEDLTCDELDSPPASGPSFAWVIVSGSEPFTEGSVVPGLTGLQFGIEHDLPPENVSWVRCASGLQIPTEGWPGSGSGIALTWIPCHENDRPSAIAGFFHVPDASTGSLSIAPHPLTDTIEVTDCVSRLWTICEESAGSVDLASGSPAECGTFAAPVAPPGDLAAEVLGCDVRLTWTHDGVGVTTFEVARDGAFVAFVPPGEREYVHEGAHTTSALYTIVARPTCGAGPGTSIDVPGLAPASDLQASDDLCGVVELTWSDNSTGETGYQVRRDGLVVTLPPDATMYTDTSAPVDVPIEYEVVVLSACGPGLPSEPDTGVLNGLVSAPVDLEATQSLCDVVALTWNEVSASEESYRVERDGEIIATLPPNSEAYLDTEVVPELSYTYRVFAVNFCGEAGSEPAAGMASSTGPPAPSSVAASDDLCDRVVITWTDGSADEDGFTITRDGSELATVGPGVTTYEDETGVPAVTYLYGVSAFNSCGESEQASAEGARIVDTGPVTGVPVLLEPEDGAPCVPHPVTFEWEAVPEAFGYEVEVLDGCGGAVVASATTPATTVSIGVPGGPLAWRVRGVNSCGDLAGPWSACHTFTAQADELDAPVLDVHNLGDGESYLFEWPPVAGAVGYRLLIALGFDDCLDELEADFVFEVAGTDTIFEDPALLQGFGAWLRAVDCTGLTGPPSECILIFPGGGGTPVVLEYFRARPVAGGVVAEWATGHELDIDGFSLYRESAGGPRVRVTPTPVPAGAGVYAYTDVSAMGSTTYTYVLMEVTDGGEELELARTTATTAASVARLRLDAHPNPFNPRVTLTAYVPRSGRAIVDLMDASGQLVRRLVDEPVEAGVRSYVWDGTDGRGRSVASGIYFARIEVGGDRRSHRLVLLK
jgi:hypothetical protein